MFFLVSSKYERNGSRAKFIVMPFGRHLLYTGPIAVILTEHICVR